MKVENKFSSIDEVNDYSKKRLTEFSNKLKEAIAKVSTSEEATRVLRALTGRRGCSEILLSSDLSARWKASRCLTKLLCAHRKAHTTGNRAYYLVTFIENAGQISDRVPIVPLQAIKVRVYRALKAVDLHGMAVVEVHPLMNYPREGKGRTLLYHVHAIAWADGIFDPADALKTIVASGAWQCDLGADPVQIDRIGPGKVNVATVAHYLLKPPHSAKNRMPSKTKEGAFLLMDTLKGYRPELALRVFEGLSQVELMDTIFGIGEGTNLRQALRSELSKWHRGRVSSGAALYRDFDIWRFWYELRAKKGSRNYMPYRFHGCGGLLPRSRKAKPRRPLSRSKRTDLFKMRGRMKRRKRPA